MTSLVTGEAVVLEVSTAAVPSRMLAAFLDGLIQVALGFGIAVLIGVFAGGGSTAAIGALFVVGYVLVFLGYPVLFEMLMRGRTPGKAALGLRVVRDDAGPIGFRQVFVRGLVGLIVEKPGITYFSAAVICSLIDKRGRRLGDLAAGTMVIQERVVAPKATVAMMPPPLAGWAATLDLSGLTDELALSIRSFLARSSALSDAARVELGGQLTAALDAVLRPLPPAGTPGWAYLSAVLAERRRREEAQHAVPAAYGQLPPPVYVPPTPAAAPEPEPPSGGFALPR